MTDKFQLTVVPFKAKEASPGKALRVAKIKRLASAPELQAALLVTIDKDGKAAMQCTSEDHMVLSYMMRAADLMVSGILLGEEVVDGEVFLEE